MCGTRGPIGFAAYSCPLGQHLQVILHLGGLGRFLPTPRPEQHQRRRRGEEGSGYISRKCNGFVSEPEGSGEADPQNSQIYP